MVTERPVSVFVVIIITIIRVSGSIKKNQMQAFFFVLLFVCTFVYWCSCIAACEYIATELTYENRIPHDLGIRKSRPQRRIIPIDDVSYLPLRLSPGCGRPVTRI